MKIIHIIGMLVCLTLLTGTALAGSPIELNVDNEGGTAVNMQKVVVSVSGNVATFSVSPNKNPTTGEYYPQGWFDLVGLPEGVTVNPKNAVTDKNGNTISGYKVDSSDNIGGGFTDEDGVKIVFSSTTLPQPGKNQDVYTTVHVTFNGAFKNPTAPVFGAHVAWGETINGIDSAKFASGGASIPEFPTIAVPIAAILGIMFVFGRRKQE